MMRATVKKTLIVNLLRQLGRPQSELGRRLGIHPSGVTALLDGTRKLSAEEAVWAAEFFEMGVVDVMALFGIDASSPYGMLPIRGYVDASSGDVMIREDTQGLEQIPAPFPGYGGCAVKIKGDSMSPRYLDGEAIGFTRNHQDISMLLNGEVVAETVDHRLVLKILHRGTLADHYTLSSLNRDSGPIVNVRLLWASAIDWHLPRRI